MNIFFVSEPRITMLYTGLFGIFYLILTLDVIRNRWLEKRGLGHDSDPKSGLFRAVRIHANFFEYIPFLLFMMALDEMTKRDPFWLHALGLSMLIGRLLHFLGIKKSHGTSIPRMSGMILTFVPLIILSIGLIMKGLR